MIRENLIRALRNLERIENGESVFLNPQDCEECVKQGWADTMQGNQYVLTDEGRNVLKGNA